jgi:hypothetical protein
MHPDLRLTIKGVTKAIETCYLSRIRYGISDDEVNEHLDHKYQLGMRRLEILVPKLTKEKDHNAFLVLAVLLDLLKAQTEFINSEVVKLKMNETEIARLKIVTEIAKQLVISTS